MSSLSHHKSSKEANWVQEVLFWCADHLPSRSPSPQLMTRGTSIHREHIGHHALRGAKRVTLDYHHAIGVKGGFEVIVSTPVWSYSCRSRHTRTPWGRYREAITGTCSMSHMKRCPSCARSGPFIISIAIFW